MAEDHSSSKRSSGGWITFPFITGAVMCLTLAASGWLVNLIVYLIDEFNIESIDAAQINNVVNGCICLLPMVAAIIADSSPGCFLVASLSSSISFLGIVLLSLTALLPSLRPQPCNNINGGSHLSTVGSFCGPSKLHLSILYVALALASLGMAGFRFTLATTGADQFRSNPSCHSTFFNWFFFAQYFAYVISSTVLVYVEDSVSWGLGFGLCAAANLVGTVILVLGSRYYYHQKPEGSPFTGFARVVVAAVRKRKVNLTGSSSGDYNYGSGGNESVEAAPTKSFRFLNRAALKTEADEDSFSGAVVKPWRLCTVQQVEELKRLIRIFPLWSTGIFLCTPIAIQNSMAVLQALKMDRSWGPHFKVPAGTVLVLVMLSGSISIALIDKCLTPLWLRLTSNSNNPSQLLAHLRRIGIGHVLNVLGMVVSALVESKRLRFTSPLPVAWLFPQLILVGIGEAFHLPAHVALYYQEFPESLKGSATAMVSMIIGVAFYLSTGLINAIRRSTGWLPQDINDGRLDLVFWILVITGVANFGYFVICARCYYGQSRRQAVEGGVGETKP